MKSSSRTSSNGFFRDECAASEWSTLYLVVVFAIAAILVIAVVKPMFKSAQRQQLLTPVAPREVPGK